MGLFSVPGFAFEAFCRAAVRLWYTAFDMAVVLQRTMLNAVLGKPTSGQREAEDNAARTAEATCNSGKAKLMNIAVIKEMPIHLLFVPCQAMVRIPHIFASPFIRLIQKISGGGNSFIQLGEEGGEGMAAGTSNEKMNTYTETSRH